MLNSNVWMSLPFSYENQKVFSFESIEKIPQIFQHLFTFLSFSAYLSGYRL